MPVRELLVATTNPGKLSEVQAFLDQLPLRIVSLGELKNPPEVIEDGASFEANAVKKARTLAEHAGYLTLADDSGLEVEALGGAPGIYSARYGGGGDAHNNQRLLREMSGVCDDRRAARFVCALALCAPQSRGGRQWIIRDTCAGRIASAPKGDQGFGYDPVFYYPPLGVTFGELDRQTKATVSHRGKALKKLAELFPDWADAAVQP